MASLVNTSTLAIVRSVNTPEFSSPWTVISESNAETWSAIEQKYRKWVTDHVEEMSAGEKTTVDTAARDAQRDAQTAQEIDNVESTLRAFMLSVREELNLHADKINAILTAIDNGANLAAVKTNVAAIADYPQRTVAQLRNSVRSNLGELTMASGDIVGILSMIVQPATLGASEDTRVDGSTPVAHLPVYDFDDTAIEYLDFYGRLEGYDGGGLTINFDWSATDTTVTPHDVVWSAAIRRIAHDAEDMDASHTYDYNNASADTEASASGEFSTVNVTFTNGADMDSLADGEPFVLRVRRVPTDGGDTLTGDAELWAFSLLIKET